MSPRLKSQDACVSVGRPKRKHNVISCFVRAIRYLNAFTSGRYLSIFGHIGREQVQDSNLMAHVVAALMFLLAIRQCFYLVEQPADSIMFEFPAIASAMEATGGVVYTTYQYYWGTKLAKGTLLLTNLPEDIISGITRPKPKLERGASSSFWKDDGKWTAGSRVANLGPCVESGEASDHQILGCVFGRDTIFRRWHPGAMMLVWWLWRDSRNLAKAFDHVL